MRALGVLTLICICLSGCAPKAVTGKVLGAWRNSISDDELYIIREGEDVLVCYQVGKEVHKTPTVLKNGHGLEFPKSGKRISLFYADSTDCIQVMGVEYQRIVPDTSSRLYPQAKKLSEKLVTCLDAASKAGHKNREAIAGFQPCRPYLEAMNDLESNFRYRDGELFPGKQMQKVYQAQEVIAIMQQIMKKDHTNLYVYGLEIWK